MDPTPRESGPEDAQADGRPAQADEHHDHEHGAKGDANGHGHAHDAALGSLLDEGSSDGIRALKIGTVGLGVTALVQFAVVAMSGSAGLLSDAFHNLGDVLTTIALWIAFVATKRAANDRYTFGYQRFEDLAGLGIVLAIFASAGIAAYESFHHLRAGDAPRRVWLAMGAAAVGIVGNEAVAQIKIRAGRRIGSDALIAEGQHSRVDGLTSAAALLGLVGVVIGVPWTDAAAGLLIAALIVVVGYRSGRPIVAKLVDRIDPAIVEKIARTAVSVDEVGAVHSIRARHAGRGLYVVMHIDLPEDTRLDDAHALSEEVRHRVMHSLPQVVDVDIHVDPAGDVHHERTAHHFGGDARPAD